MKFRHYFLSLLLFLITCNSFAMRNRLPLEAFELDQLKIMHISLKGKCAPFALIRDTNGYVHQIFMGGYMGKNFGYIKKITKKGIELQEVFQDSEGEWESQKKMFLIEPTPLDLNAHTFIIK